MHRTQLNLTDFQYQYLLAEAKRTGASLSELIRNMLQQKIEPGRGEQALRKAMVGLGKSKKGDLSKHHDEYLYS